MDTVPIKELPSALEARDEIVSRLRRARPAFFFDYDGTLTPIVENPDDAVLHPGMHAVLERLVAVAPVVIVSGRDVRFIVEHVAIDGVVFAGSHGFDIVGPLDLELDADQGALFDGFLPTLDSAEEAITEAVSDVPGARIERKKYAIAVHYRQVDESDVHLVAESVAAVLAEHPTLRKGEGKKVYELRPDIDWDKGRAVLWLLAALGYDGCEANPFYLGDDVTDEDAFAVLHDIGVSIVVGAGDRQSAAAFALQSVDEVESFLGAVADALEGARG